MIKLDGNFFYFYFFFLVIFFIIFEDTGLRDSCYSSSIANVGWLAIRFSCSDNCVR